MKTTKVLLYCTKSTPYLVKDDFPLENKPIYYTHYKEDPRCFGLPLNGKIVAECEVETEELKCACVPYRNKNNLGYEHYIDNGVYKVNWSSKDSINNNLDGDGVVFERNDKYIDTMLKNDDLSKMCLSPQQLYDYVGLGNKFYALHIKKLKTFDSKPLTDYGVNKAPQNMMRAYKDGQTYILISIRPEWICKILNRKKTIEVRRKVLKEML